MVHTRGEDEQSESELGWERRYWTGLVMKRKKAKSKRVLLEFNDAFIIAWSLSDLDNFELVACSTSPRGEMMASE
jgi:hypothetical protein